MADRMLGRFYMGAESLRHAGNTITSDDSLTDAIARASEEVKATGKTRYVVQVVAKIEPQPPTPPPVKVTIMSADNMVVHG